MRAFILLALVCLSFVSGAVQSTGKKSDDAKAQKKDPQLTFEPRSGPGEGQKFLQKFVGDWNVQKAFYPRGGGEPSRATGECKQTMIHDGRFLQSDFVFGSGSART